MFKNFIKLSVSNAGAQGIQWLAVIVCTHYYTAEIYGHFYIGVSIVGMLGILSSLQMHQVIVVVREESDIREVFKIGIISNIFLMLIAVIAAMMVNRLGLFHVGWIYLFTLALILLVSGLSKIYQGWCVKIGAFGVISKAILVRAVILSATQLILGFVAIKEGLLFGMLAGELAALIYIGVLAGAPSIQDLIRGVDFERIFRFIRKYDDFVIGGTLSECVSTIAFSLPVVLFGWRYSSIASGHFSISHRMIWAPMAMLGFALAQVMYKRLADIEIGDLHKSPLFKNFIGLIGVAAIASVFGSLIVVSVIRPFMKASWANAYEYMPPLIGWGMFFLASTAYRISYRVLVLQRLHFVINAAFLMWVGGLFLFVAPQISSVRFAYLLGVSGIVHQLVLMLFIRGRIYRALSLGKSRSYS